MHRHGRRRDGAERRAANRSISSFCCCRSASSRPSFARTIGVLAPLKVPPWLGASPIGALTLGGRRHVGAALEKRLLPRFMAPRGRRGLVVYEGGTSTSPLRNVAETDRSAA